MPHLLRKFVAPLVVVILGVVAAAPVISQERSGSPMLLGVDPAALQIVRDSEPVTSFDVEVADSPDERARGLMFRDDFPDDRAMLFVFENERPLYFWMRNTPRPLDILYATSDGTVKTIARDTTPFSDRPIPSGAPVRFALEINAGAADRLGLRVGDVLLHPVISAIAD
ncbi:DUF192 domain-containing protein [Oricola cellulosilytica]|uniref:DUF192 domain-containing protein n=1 Tax=Oricola cellulosilytica TaxID=1429082 RepID=A0A4R0PGI1_9HYPH|nr:DUF192 domain-containing protein [Oricola cellulosilytica]TCD14564.1 DUF192 domain-containing protein [Oricola cellulosilytica]